MTDLDFEGFDWDAGNSTKSHKKHGISQEAIEAFFANEPEIIEDPRHSSQERRWLAVGRGEDQRWLIVAFTLRSKAGKKTLRPISARYMHAKEAKRHEKRH